jgi:hypothetical protein
MIPVEKPFQVFTDINGAPLNVGSIYIGQPNQNPKTAPITVYWDEAGTIPAQQPLTTRNGYIYRSGKPANVYVNGEYSIAVYTSANVLVYYAENSANFATDQILRNDLASSSGAGQVGFLPEGTGAVETNLQAIARKWVFASNYGLSTSASAAANITAMMNALNVLKNKGGGILIVEPGDYDFGSHATSDAIVSVSDLANVLIYAYGARFIVETTAEATPFLFYFDSPNNVVLAGARFFDSGFNPASWTTHSRWGMGAVALQASSNCRGFKMVDCDAENLTYLLVGDFRANKRKFEDIAVVNCRVKNAYYGVDLIYAGDNLKVDNLICEDVRRGYISFGARNADVDIKLYTSSGFLGSNAFISIGCEGTTYNDGYGVLGNDGNVENVRIKLNVTGYEAHESYVHFYHQQADSPGAIANVDADVKLNNLSSTGKAAGLGATNVFLFDHELPTTAILGVTQRNFKQITLSGGILGAVTGLPIKFDSVNPSDPPVISISPNLTRSAHTYTLMPLTTDVKILTPFDRAFSLTPVGTTSAGTASGLVSNGTWMEIGKRVFFNAFLSWSGHTGTGQLRLNGLPRPIDTAYGNPQISVFGSGVTHTAGTTLRAMAGGAGSTQILLYEENAGVLTALPMDTAVGGLYVSGTYVTP